MDRFTCPRCGYVHTVGAKECCVCGEPIEKPGLKVKAHKQAIEEIGHQIRGVERLFLDTIRDFEAIHGVTIVSVDLIRNQCISKKNGELVSVQMEVKI